MFRQLIKISQNLTRLDYLNGYRNLQYGSQLGFCRNQKLIPIRQFSQEISANWPESIKQFLEKEKISEPTLIQRKTLPIAMENKDLVGIARTGSGKTLAFAIPAIMKILKERESSPQQRQQSDEDDDLGFRGRSRGKLPSCLVLAPTRELASQTHDVFKKFRNLGIKSIALVGGASRSEQVRELSYQDQDIYIATPGRLIDLIESDMVDLSQTKYLVLDEADRMLDMGFEPQIRNIIKRIPDQRQTLMWSATWPKEIQSLARDFMKDFEYIAVDSEKLKANPNIKQTVTVCRPFDKLRKMLECLSEFEREAEAQPRVLVFVNTKRTADQLLIQLMRNRHRAIAMHGNRSQKQRDDALRLFKNRSCNILVATDVAARGLDINDITHVINYDFPNTIEDYIHRIGRTARHEKKGVSISFLTDENCNLSRKLVHVLKETNQEVPEELHQLTTMTPINHKPMMNRRPRDDFYSRGGGGGGGGFGRGDFGGRNFRNNRGYDDSRYSDRGRSRLSSFDYDEPEDDEFDDYNSNYRSRQSNKKRL